ncbi:hypothetical protein [Comamonas odontotermitis]|uniref:hypothetical protein n=1 Tax=Comamonas odontotermitis TaxID=379895 RepID=UPI003751D0DD
MHSIRKLLFLVFFLAANLLGGLAYAEKILILNLYGEFMQPNSNLKSGLESDGHQVTVVVNSYPSTLATSAQDAANGYDQVWVFMNDADMSRVAQRTALKQSIISYLSSGGRVYLQTEVSCCGAAAMFVKDILATVVKPSSVLANFDHTVIRSGGQALINNAVAGAYGGEGLCRAVSTSAYRETSGVKTQNQIVVSSDNLESTVAAFFPETDLNAGAGRLVVLGDINFYGPGFGAAMPVQNLALAQMFANILQGREVISTCPLAEADVFSVYNMGVVMQTMSVLLNDQENRFSATAATISNVNMARVGSVLNASGVAEPGIDLVASSGVITVQPSVANGVYRLTYRICQKSNTQSCVVNIASILVQGPTVDAVIDDFTATPFFAAVGGTTESVLANDRVNGITASSLNAVLTQQGVWPAEISINGDGIIAVAPKAAVGDYALTYQICMLPPRGQICETAIATLTVKAINVQAANDDYSSIPVKGSSGGSLPSVLANDTINGSSASAANAQATSQGAWPNGIQISVDGAISVSKGTPAGKYSLSYQLCSVADPTACSLASVTLTIEAESVPSVPTSVPSLQQWAVVALSLILTLCGVSRLRRYTR